MAMISSYTLCRRPMLPRRVETCRRPSGLTEVTVTCLEDLLAWYFTEPSASKKPLRPYPTSVRDASSDVKCTRAAFRRPQDRVPKEAYLCRSFQMSREEIEAG